MRILILLGVMFNVYTSFIQVSPARQQDALSAISVLENLCHSNSQNDQFCVDFVSLMRAPKEHHGSVDELKLQNCSWQDSSTALVDFMSGPDGVSWTKETKAHAQNCIVEHWFHTRVGRFATSSASSWWHFAARAQVPTPYITGRTFGSIDKFGNLYSNPPLTVHHGHFAAVDIDNNDMAQQHGQGHGNAREYENEHEHGHVHAPKAGDGLTSDMQTCYPNDVSCSVLEYPAGFGFRVPSLVISAAVLVYATSNASTEFYQLFSFRTQVSPCRTINFYHIVNPPSPGMPRGNFLAPASRWLMWYQWRWPINGKLAYMQVHSHWSMLDMQVLIFSGTYEQLGLPWLGNGSVFEYTGSPIKKLSEIVLRTRPGERKSTAAPRLRCLPRSPSHVTIDGNRYDRSVHFPCTSWPFGVRESAVAVAFADNIAGQPVKQHLHFNSWIFPEDNHSDVEMAGQTLQSSVIFVGENLHHVWSIDL